MVNKRKNHKRGKKKGGYIPVGAIWNAIPASVKAQVGKQLAKDFTLRVAAPIAAAIGAKKLYSKLKAR